MSTTRRSFLQSMSAAGVVSLGGLPPEFLNRAAQADDGKSTSGRVLVLVQLAGGNDGLNTVIPFKDDDYYKARPGVNIGRGATLKLNDELGLHPAMTGFKELFDEGQLAIVQGVGYENPDRSHFRSMDIWQSARPDAEYTRDGWLGRALDQSIGKTSGTMPALALGTEKLPLTLVSTKVNVPAVQNLRNYRLDLGKTSVADQQRHRKLLSELAAKPATAGSELDFLRRTTTTAVTSAKRLREITSNYKPTKPYPQNSLAQKLKLVAQFIAADLGTRIYFVSLGGFDTHAQQEGAHTALLQELSSAVTAFIQDLDGRGLRKQVLLATFSEFGRRVKENGSLGTDHGSGSQLFVVSPKQAGLIGKHPSLTDLVQGDLKFHTDFRRVYATLLDRWLQIPSEPVLGARFEPLGFA